MLTSLPRRWYWRLALKVMFSLNRKKTLAKWNPTSTLTNAFQHILDTFNYRKKYLPMIKAPTLIIGAGRCQFIGKETYQETSDLIPNAKLVLFKNETHTVTFERAKVVGKYVKEFLLEN